MAGTTAAGRRGVAVGLRVAAWLALGSLLVAGAGWLGHWANPPPLPPAGAAPGPEGGPVFVRGLLNALPFLLLCLVVLGLTRRLLLSLALTALPMAALHGANALKLDALDVPLIPADLALLPQLLRGSDVLWHYAGALGVGPLGAIAAAVLLILLARLEPRLPLRAAARRCLAAGAALALATLGAGLTPWPALYAAHGAGFWPWDPRRSVDAAGLETSLLRYHWQLGLAAAPADAARVRAFLRSGAALPDAAANAPAPAAADAPDIVVVQSESLFDPGRLNGIDSRPLLPALHRLAAGGRSGALWVPTYGGGTVRTEFEVLTGIALRYAPTLDYPYLQLPAVGRRSLPQVLRSRGYRTAAIHPNDGSFWNRSATFRGMGFERFLDGSAFGEARRRGYYVADEELTPRILGLLDDGPGPHFVFVVSIENHGPYSTEQPDLDAGELASIAVPSPLAPAEAAALRVYLLHLRHADAALGALAQALAARPRRSLLFFYGDHLPGLGAVYERLGFRDGEPGERQPVPYVLVDSAGDTPQRTDLAANFVPGWLLARAGIRDEPFFAVAQQVRRATRFGPGYTPAFDADFAEINRLRLQQGFCDLFDREKPQAGYACPTAALAADGAPLP